MSEVKFKGTITLIKDTLVISEKFQKREFVVTDNGMYPQMVLFQVVQDKCSMLDNNNVGEEVEISYNLLGREWTSPTGEVKYFNTLDAWKISKANAMIDEQPSLAPNDTDDLPF